MYRTRSAGHDTEDLALLFMEEEVGRFDWKNNWPKIVATGTARKRVQDWLAALNIDHDPESIINYLNEMVKGRAGKWL